MKLSFINKRIAISLVVVFTALNLFGYEVLIRKDTQSDPPTSNVAKTTSLLSAKTLSTKTTVIPVSAAVENDLLIINFDLSVQYVSITVLDSSNQVVYENAINPTIQSEETIDISTWPSDSYTIKISYGTENLTGEFVK